jgi:predicted kinase
MLKSGFLHTRDGWNDETQRQLDLARDNVASVAKNFVGAGISVVIDDVVFPRWEVSGIDRWRSALSPIEADLVVLFPSWQVVAERNSGRSGHKLLPDEMLRQIFDDMGGWQDQTAVDVIDNSFLSAAEAVKAIAQGVMPRQQEEAE